ncbi:hypothetical protein CDAR_95981 [Caerostris darwini]|uniref:Uncharacterized protein n=1 Tax=Caerostris darwini TaxID=1538125 RepID=A0AAV4UQB1_9ARAC|nr:hypothetical protein CDAR_95981 [Caerostris darwini]
MDHLLEYILSLLLTQNVNKQQGMSSGENGISTPSMSCVLWLPVLYTKNTKQCPRGGHLNVTVPAYRRVKKTIKDYQKSGGLLSYYRCQLIYNRYQVSPFPKAVTTTMTLATMLQLALLAR